MSGIFPDSDLFQFGFHIRFVLRHLFIELFGNIPDILHPVLRIRQAFVRSGDPIHHAVRWIEAHLQFGIVHILVGIKDHLKRRRESGGSAQQRMIQIERLLQFRIVVNEGTTGYGTMLGGRSWMGHLPDLLQIG
jgi:hypothetical protein